ncbi:hypothetical protein ED236_01295 [Pseudomethylobacillus aquaticus]|uniref:Uncharacterized protein n=1 Tax=Pseudomethylobacillus aquaticus TaxID=2676064 RepID=A0A3N0V5V3_9PROT|nr:hypothetical protein [Pseudomethylobacillus aquaticus]ROH88139.1 hypothetical protein ED236_01295 [Pseudomethylobacillus aquaticus]
MQAMLHPVDNSRLTDLRSQLIAEQHAATALIELALMKESKLKESNDQAERQRLVSSITAFCDCV